MHFQAAIVLATTALIFVFAKLLKEDMFSRSIAFIRSFACFCRSNWKFKKESDSSGLKVHTNGEVIILPQIFPSSILLSHSGAMQAGHGEHVVPSEESHAIFGDQVQSATSSAIRSQSGGQERKMETTKMRDTQEDHCHWGARSSEVDQRALTRLVIALVLCCVFMIGEVVGGWIANSVAVMTDAAHMLIDFFSFIISLLALFMSSKRASKRFTFGHHRAEVLGALFGVFLTWVVTGILVYLAIMRLCNGDYEVQAVPMLITASAAVVFNLFMAFVLHPPHASGHSHAHKRSSSANVANLESPSTSATRQNDRSSLLPNVETERSLNEAESASSHSHDHTHENLNVRSAFIHVLGDLCQSVGVLVSAIIIYFKRDWQFIDPICTFLFSVLVIITTLRILRDTLLVLMEGWPHGVDYAEVHKAMLSVDREKVMAVHDLRVWSLTLSRRLASVHLVIRRGDCSDELLSGVLMRLRSLMRERFAIEHLTVQFEKHCVAMDSCESCKLHNSPDDNSAAVTLSHNQPILV